MLARRLRRTLSHAGACPPHACPWNCWACSVTHLAGAVLSLSQGSCALQTAHAGFQEPSCSPLQNSCHGSWPATAHPASLQSNSATHRTFASKNLFLHAQPARLQTSLSAAGPPRQCTAHITTHGFNPNARHTPHPGSTATQQRHFHHTAPAPHQLHTGHQGYGCSRKTHSTACSLRPTHCLLYTTAAEPPQSAPTAVHTGTDHTEAPLLQRLQPHGQEQIVRGDKLYPFTLKRYQLPPHVIQGEDGEYLQWAIALVKQLRHAGHSAYFAGGWVRDALLGRPSQDIDIATSANVYQELPLIFPSFTVKQLMRSTARVERGGLSLEVTQLRGTRKENDLESLALDACLRDFTLNSLYYDPESHEILDFMEGVTHLRERRLELPPHPAQPPPHVSNVINEDPLRVLRAVRFAADLECTLSRTLVAEVRSRADRCRFETQTGVAGVGNRRLFRELSKVCLLGRKDGRKLSQAFKLMAQLNITQALCPDLVLPSAEECFRLQSALTEAAQKAAESGGSPLPAWSPEIRLLVLIDPTQDRVSRQMINAVSERMRLSLRDVWQESLYRDAETLLELHTELYRECGPGEVHHVATGADGQPDLLPLLKHRIKQDVREMDWIRIFSVTHYPLLETWLLAWQPEEVRSQLQHHMEALRQDLKPPQAHQARAMS